MHGYSGLVNVEKPLKSNWAGALVWWLLEETHVQEVVGSNPGPDTGWPSFSHYIVEKIVMFV